MASAFLPEPISFPLEIQVVNKSKWNRYVMFNDGVKDQEGFRSASTSAIGNDNGLLSLMVNGSFTLSLLVLKYSLPSIFKFRTASTFLVNKFQQGYQNHHIQQGRKHNDKERAQESVLALREKNQNAKTGATMGMFDSLDDFVISIILSYLDEHTIISVMSATCFRMRYIIASDIFIETLLGKRFRLLFNKFESDMRAQQGGSSSSSSSSSVVLDYDEVFKIDTNVVFEIEKARQQIQKAISFIGSKDIDDLVKNPAEATKVDNFMWNVIKFVQFPTERLSLLMFSLQARRDVTQMHINKLRTFRTACDFVSRSHGVLSKIICACQLFDRLLLAKESTSLSNQYDIEKIFADFGMPLPSLLDLQTVKSRFNSEFNGMHAVLLILIRHLYSKKGSDENPNASFSNLSESLGDLLKDLIELHANVSLIVERNAENQWIITAAKTYSIGYGSNGTILKRMNQSLGNNEFIDQMKIIFRMLKPSFNELKDEIERTDKRIDELFRYTMPDNGNPLAVFKWRNESPPDFVSLKTWLASCISELTANNGQHLFGLFSTTEEAILLESKAIGEMAAKVAANKESEKTSVKKELSAEFVQSKDNVQSSLMKRDEGWKKGRDERNSSIRDEIVKARSDNAESSESENVKTQLQNILLSRSSSFSKPSASASDATDATEQSSTDKQQGQDVETAANTSSENVSIEKSGSFNSPKIPNPPSLSAVETTEAKASQSKQIETKRWIHGRFDVDPSSEIETLWTRTLHEFIDRKCLHCLPSPEVEEFRKIFSTGQNVSGLQTATKQLSFKTFSNEAFHYGNDTSNASITNKSSAAAGGVVDYSKTAQKMASFRENVVGISPPKATPSVPISLISVASASSSISPLIPAVTKIEEKDVKPEKFYTLKELVDMKLRGELQRYNIVPSYLEKYLTDEEFDKAFKMNRDAFSKMQGWKKEDVKKKLGLW